MRYKVLLVGNNKATIEDMFLHANNILECQSTSSRFDDIVCHLKYFQPHVLVYCMNNETRDTMSQLITIKHTKLERKTPFLLSRPRMTAMSCAKCPRTSQMWI